MTDWTYWPTDDKWTADLWGFGVCVVRLEESGYYRYALYDRDVEQTEPIRIGFCATLEHAKTAVEHVIGLYLISADD